MTTINMDIDKTTMSFISKKNIDINTYVLTLIKEDILLNQIQESKKSWVLTLDSLSDLDN